MWAYELYVGCFILCRLLNVVLAFVYFVEYCKIFGFLYFMRAYE